MSCHGCFDRVWVVSVTLAFYVNPPGHWLGNLERIGLGVWEATRGLHFQRLLKDLLIPEGPGIYSQIIINTFLIWIIHKLISNY